MMLGAFAKRAQQLCRSAAAVLCCQGILFSHHNKFHAIQNWVSQGSYKTRIWLNQKSRSGGFYVCFKLLGLGVVFCCMHSVSAFLRHLALATIWELSVFPKRRSRHFYFSTVDGSILLPSGESELWRRLVEVFTSTLYLLCVSVTFYFQY